MSIWKSLAWVTIGFLVLSLVGHRLFGSFLFVKERQAHGERQSCLRYIKRLTAPLS